MAQRIDSSSEDELETDYSGVILNAGLATHIQSEEDWDIDEIAPFMLSVEDAKGNIF